MAPRTSILLCLVLSWVSVSFAQTSSWTDPNADVVIPAGQRVVVDSPIIRARNLTNWGELVIPSDRAVEIAVACSVLNYGVIRDAATSWDRRHTWFAQWTKATAAGIVGGPNYLPSDCSFWNFGRWESEGVQVTRWWSKLATDVMPGSSTVTVDGDLSDWPIGGLVGLSHTNDGETVGIENNANRVRAVADETEYGTIAAISGYDGQTTTLTLTAPLVKAHAGTGLFRGELALYSRSITFQTQLEGFQPSTVDPRNRLFASLIFMPNPNGDGTRITHSGGASGRLCNVGFTYMGAYGKDGRPALHLHRLGDGGREIDLCGLSFYMTAGNAMNIHETNGVYVEEPVAGHHAGGAVYMQQTDDVTQTADNVTVRGLSMAHSSKAFSDRASTVPGEFGRAATCYWMGVSEHEAFMGNVCAGGTPNGQEATGVYFPERPTSTNGTIPRVFLLPEAHGLTSAGVYSWQNRSVGVDMVGATLWGSGVGIRLGAYGFPLHVYNSTIRARIGIARNVVSSLVQDTRFIGRGPNAPRLITDPTRYYDNGADTGIAFGIYSIQPHPHQPSRYYRNLFEQFTPDAAGTPGVAVWRQVDNDPDNCNPLNPFQSDTFALARYCSSAFVRLAQQTYRDGIQPALFGGTTHPRPHWPNTGSHWVDHDRGLVLLRRDMTTPDGPFAPALVTATSFDDPTTNALATPLSSLPTSVTFTGLRSYRDRPYGPFTLDLTYNPPPVVTMQVQVEGDHVRWGGTTSADTTRLECWINEIKIREVALSNGGPYTCETDLPRPDRRWHYAWVVAYDGFRLNAGFGENGGVDAGFEQHAYANPPVVEISPEMLRVAAPPPPPDPTVEQLKQQLAALAAEVQQYILDRDNALTSLVSVTQSRDQLQQQQQALQALLGQVQQALQVESAQRLVLEQRIEAMRAAIAAAMTVLAGVP